MLKISNIENSNGRVIRILHDENSLDIDPENLDFNLSRFSYDSEYIRWDDKKITLLEIMKVLQSRVSSHTCERIDLDALRMAIEYLRNDKLKSILNDLNRFII